MFDKKAYNHQYYARHRAEMNEQSRQYRADHRDTIKQYNRRYGVDHKEEIKQYHIDHRDARNEQSRQYQYKNGAKPMAENCSCSQFLGVHVAEQVLSQLFKNVIRMPNNNPDFDFKCANGYMIDCKAGCRRVRHGGAVTWQFNIRKNAVADYFLCMAFDNRKLLNPEHIWLIPGMALSHLSSAAISETTLDRWAEYKKPIDEAISCCDTMRGDSR